MSPLITFKGILFIKVSSEKKLHFKPINEISVWMSLMRISVCIRQRLGPLGASRLVELAPQLHPEDPQQHHRARP